MKTRRFLITLLALSLILALASCEIFDLLKEGREEALATLETLAGSEEYASLDKEQVKSIIEEAERGISEAKSADDIRLALDNAKAQLDALVLGGIMQTASNELYSCVNLDLYSEENVKLIQSKMEAANERIFACENADDVASVLAEAIAEITAIKPALDEAKEAASSAIEKYVDLSLYSEENKALVEAQIAAAKAEIATLETVNAVEERLISAKAAIDEIHTILDEAKEAALAELKGHITDKSIYSSKGLSEIDRIIADAEENLEAAESTTVIDAIVEDAKADLDAVLTADEERIAAAVDFKNSVTIAINDGDILNDETFYADNGSVIVKAVDGNTTRICFGSRENNSATVFDTYIKFSYRSTEWSLATLFFRAWDDSTAYKADIRNGSIEFAKGFWNTETSGQDKTVLLNDPNGIKGAKEVHLQVISWGWTKMVLIDGECVFKIVEDDYNAGGIYIQTWQTGYTLRDPIYKEYATDAELEADYSEELAKECVNKTVAQLLAERKESAKTEILGYVDFDKYSTENQVVINGIIEAGNTIIDGCTSTDAVDAAVVQIKSRIDGVPTAQAEAELADAKQAAKEAIAGHLSDVESNYSAARQAEIAAIISAGNTAIDACTSLSEVQAAMDSVKAQLSEIPTLDQEANAELFAKQNAAKEELAGYLQNVSTAYSAESQNSIQKILTEANAAIMACTSEAEVDAAVTSAKANLDAVLTIAQEEILEKNAKLEAFKATLVHAGGSNIIEKMSVSDGKLIVDSKQAGLGGVFKFGNQDGNMNKAFDAKITVHYNSNEGSSVILRFCAWDTNTTFKMVIKNDSIAIYETSWNDGAVDTLLVEHTSGVANDTEAHIQIITRGWTKAVLVNGVCIFKTWPNKLHVGYTMIETWETGIELRDVTYKEYGSEAEVTADYDEELGKESIYANPYA